MWNDRQHRYDHRLASSNLHSYSQKDSLDVIKRSLLSPTRLSHSVVRLRYRRASNLISNTGVVCGSRADSCVYTTVDRHRYQRLRYRFIWNVTHTHIHHSMHCNSKLNRKNTTLVDGEFHVTSLHLYQN